VKHFGLLDLHFLLLLGLLAQVNSSPTPFRRCPSTGPTGSGRTGGALHCSNDSHGLQQASLIILPPLFASKATLELNPGPWCTLPNTCGQGGS